MMISELQQELNRTEERSQELRNAIVLQNQQMENLQTDLDSQRLKLEEAEIENKRMRETIEKHQKLRELYM